MAARSSLGRDDRDRLRRAMREAIARFDEQIAALTRSFDNIVEASELVNTDDEHDPEGTTIAFERSQVHALLQQADADRDALVDSMQRVDEAEFGTCETCGAGIGVDRLLALPWTSRCITCAS